MSVPVVAALDPQSSFVQVCYIVAFSLFIFGIRRGTHPTTAKQGNLIAATGMAIAVVTTLALRGIGNWGLIAIGIVAGAVVGVVASRRVQMTAITIPVAAIRLPRRAVVGRVPCRTPKMKSEKAAM